MQKLTIGQVAEQSNVNLQTIRSYERRGLLPEPPRNQIGHRQYSRDAVVRTQFIKRAQALGFTLKETSEFIALRVERGTSCEAVKTRVEIKIADVEKKMAYLKQMRESLIDLSKKCIGRGPVGKCPLLEELHIRERER
jgi:MerR family copper efflux transcriptional regulator